ncbi:MAG: glycosyltransferase [Halodesulfovibrio sp.]
MRIRGGSNCRLLLVGSNYYLERELSHAARMVGVEMEVFPAHRHAHDFGTALLEHMRRFRPDAVLSVNAKGLGNWTELPDVLGRMGAALCVWFIDSPEHFVAGSVPDSENLLLFSCERQAMPLLQAWGGRRVHYLPLAADATRLHGQEDLFLPEAEITASFLGVTWTEKKALCLRNGRFPRFILRRYRELGRRFAAAPEPSVMTFLSREEPEFMELARDALGSERLRDVCILICWEANTVKRVPMVRALLPFAPVIAGDAYWKQHIPAHAGVRLHPPIGYYTPDLFDFYRHSRVSLNVSSAQLPTATTQRIFDIPSAGGFVISDHKDQIAECFDIGTEAVTFSRTEEIGPLVEYYAANREAAGNVVANARRRILAEHTYGHRLQAIVRALQG